MLTDKAAKLVLGLCDKIGSKEYVIYSWEEVAKCLSEDADINEVKDLFEESRLNQCISKKYEDDNEVCFAVTDKALLIKHDYVALKNAEEDATPLVQADDSGNAVLVLPKSTQELNKIKEGRRTISIKVAAFLYGILGGILGGGIIYGIIYLLSSLGA